jgi:hypothetical protein
MQFQQPVRIAIIDSFFCRNISSLAVATISSMFTMTCICTVF